MVAVSVPFPEARNRKGQRVGEEMIFHIRMIERLEVEGSFETTSLSLNGEELYGTPPFQSMRAKVGFGQVDHPPPYNDRLQLFAP